MIAPLTDHSHNVLCRIQVKAVMLLWSYLCLSVTILYAGDMAAELAVLSPPSFPTKFQELGAIPSHVVSTMSSVGSEGLEDIHYHFSLSNAYFEGKRQTCNCTPDKPTHCDEINRLTTVIDDIDRTFCPEPLTIFNTRGNKNAFECQGYPNWTQVDYSIPVTFLEPEYTMPKVKVVFESSESFWTSSITYESESLDLAPWLSRINYFAPLVSCMISAWGETGHGTYFDKRADSMKALKNFTTSEKSLYKTGKSENTKFEAMNIRSLQNVDSMFMLMLSITCFVFVVERVSHMKFESLKFKHLFCFVLAGKRDSVKLFSSDQPYFF